MKRIINLISMFLLVVNFPQLSAQSVITIGTGTSANGSSTYPTPYGNYYWGSKEQYLITASEMNSAGAFAGEISAIAFNVALPNGVPLQGFSISIDTTTNSSMTTSFFTGFTTVYSSNSYTDVSGWNTHNFQNNFYWDGTSNIVVEVCFNNSNYTNNASVYYTPTAFQSTVNVHNDQSGVCNNTIGTTYNQRPNIQFTMLPLISNNLGVIDLISPNPYSSNTPSANFPVTILVKNYGTSPQVGFSIGYSINGGSFVSETYTDSIFPGDTLFYTFNTNANLSANGYYSIVSYVSSQGDGYQVNDTLYRNAVVCNPISGSFTIGSDSSNDFHNFQELANALSGCGISGPVTVSVASGTYNEQVTFNYIPGASSINTITISSASGNPNDVVLQYDNQDYYSNYTLRLSDADYVTIQNITIKNTNTNTSSTAVSLENQAEHNRLLNNILISTTSYNGPCVNDNNNGYNTYKYNIISGGSNGLDIQSYDTYSPVKGTIIDSNQISGFGGHGIYAYYLNEIKIRGNWISNGQASYIMGIYLYHVNDDFDISGNNIKLISSNQAYGLYMYNCNNGLSSDTTINTGLVANNMISLETYGGASAGIYSSFNENTLFSNNSVLMTGNESSSRAIYQINSSYLSLPVYYINNIFCNKSGGYAAYFSNPSAMGACDYNNYYSEKSMFVYWAGDKFNLADLKLDTTKNVHSVSINPGFYDFGNLHSSSFFMSDKGVFISMVTNDFDGDLRSTSSPDMGADEYTPPQNNITVVGAHSTTATNDVDCDLGNETIVVTIINNGAATQTSIPLSFKLDNYSTVNETWTGSLASGDTLQYLFTALANFTQAGLHKLTIFSGLSNDQNRLDDTVRFSFNTYQSIQNIPFTYNFESPVNLYFHMESSSEVSAQIDSIHGLNSASAIYMIGGQYYNEWYYNGSDLESNLQNNYNHLAKAELCPFDASSYTNLRMSFQLDQNNSNNPNNSFFFVKINDSLYAKTLDGDSVWHEHNGSMLVFDLAPYVGGTIKISFEALLRTNEEYYYGQVDDVTIDNLNIYVPANNDVGVVDIVDSDRDNRCGTTIDSIYVKIKNFGLIAQSNIPVVFNMTFGPTQYNFNATYTDTLAPNDEDYIYVGYFDNTVNGQISVTCYTNKSTDQNRSNDTMFFAGYQERYKPIPFVETFQNNTNHWSNFDFYIKDIYYQTGGASNNVLYLEKYGNAGEAIQPPFNPNNVNINAFASYETPIGYITPNTYLMFDYRFFNFNNIDDSINFALNSNCGTNFQNVYSINSNTNFNPYAWTKAVVPIGSFAGSKVQLLIYKPEKYNSYSDFELAIDNIAFVEGVSFSLGNDTAFCSGDTVQISTGLSASNGYHFNWIGPGTKASDTLATYNVTQPGMYVAKVTNNLGMEGYDTVNVIMHSKPYSSLSISKSSICKGDSTQIFVSIVGNYPVVFDWTDGTNNFSDTAYGILQARYFSPTTSSVYSLHTLTDTFGCQINSTAQVSVTVNQNPVVTASGIETQYCSNTPMDTLYGAPSGGIFVGPGMAGNLFNAAIAGAGNKDVIYKYTDSYGCSGADTLSTIVYQAPNAAIVSTLSSVICENDNPITMVAYPTGGLFTGSGMNGSLFSPATANTGANIITYTFTDIHNCTDIDSITINVNAAPIATISTSLNGSYCSDASAVSLTGNPSGGVFSGNGVTGSIFNPAQATTGNSMIVYSYTDGFGCTDNDTVITTINPLPTVLLTTQFAAGYCQDGSMVTMSGYPSGGTFNGNGVNGTIFYPDSTTSGLHDITYDYTDIHGCTNSDTAQVTVYSLPSVSIAPIADICSDVNQLVLTGGSPSGGQYSGNAVNGYSGSFFPGLANIGLNQVKYNYTDANGCSNFATTDIKVISQPSAQFSIPAVTCKSDTVIINYIGGASTSALFSWNFDNAQAITGSGVGPYTMRWDTAGIKSISLVVTDSGCVSNTANNFTTVMDAIALASTVGGSTACYGDSVLIFANSGPGYSYQWFDTSGTLTSPADTLSYIYGIASGSYYAKVTNNVGCSAISNQMGVTVYPMISSNFTMPAVACKNGIVNIAYNGTPDGNAIYNWNFNGGQIASGSGSGPYGIIWGTDSIKHVSLMVENYGCSSETTTNNINIITTPAVITALGPTTFCDGGNVTLYPNSGANLAYEWYRNGVSLSNTNAIYTATQAGQYKVKVTNTAIGCVNTSAAVNVVVNTTNFNLAFTTNQTNFTIPPFDITITNQTPDTANYYWNWFFGDGGVSASANPFHHYQYDGTYTLGVVAQNVNTGCYDTLVKNNYIHCTGGNINPCSLVATITPTGPKTICPGDSIKLTAALNAGATYQWLKDGVIISGADTTFYWAKQTGNYQIMVANTACSKFSLPFSLSVYNTITPIISSNGSIMPCSSDSMELYVTSTFNKYLWSNGDTTSNIYITTSGNYTVIGTDVNNCKTESAPYVVNASLLQTPDICIVGVDSATNSNYVVWERQANPLIDSFRVYRESNVSGVYNLIGTTSVNDPGYFLDPISNPMQQAYRYKITAIDTCGMETPPSAFHKTIHLTINKGVDSTYNLIWSHYVGFNFGSYRIYRGYDSLALQPLTQIQSTLNSYTDLNPPSGKVYYQIECVSPHPCYPDSIFSKAKTNYNTSRSNNVNTSMATPPNGLTDVLVTSYSVQVYPNPNKGSFEMVLTSDRDDVYQVSVKNVLGQEIYNINNIKAYGTISKSINMGKPAPGIYYLVIESRTERVVKKIVIN